MNNKSIKNNNLINYKSEKKQVHYLDTLEVTSEIFKNKTHESLYYSTLRKHSTISKLKLIIDIIPKKESKKYWKTFHCNKVKIISNETIKGSLCRKRWCAQCNRIKTAEMVNAYSSSLKELESENELYMVTLTAPTCNERQLKSEIKKRYQIFVLIKDRLRKKGVKLNGLRKIEVTYNENSDKYHPHFHFIQQGLKESNELLNEWLNYYRKHFNKVERAQRKAQDISPIRANGKDLVEVMKYATKDIVKDNTSAYAYHNIMKALEGVRVFQPYGRLKKVKAPKEIIEQIEVNELTNEPDIYVYSHSNIDYLNSKNEKLINTLDIQKTIRIYEQIKSN